MKLKTYMELQKVFGEKKPKKEKKMSVIKEFIKYKKEMKEFEEWEKSNKKEDKKKTWWEELNMLQKLIILQMTVPPAVALQLMLFMLPVILIAKAFHH